MRKVPLILAISFCAVFHSSAAISQEAPNAKAEAEKIGQTIEFQDEIKAVSYSRSTDGYYLSFGEPYPKQVLSVWVSARLYGHLPGRGDLVGRIVKIKGELEKSATGPLLKLQSRESFELLEVDPAILTKPRLDGKQDRSQFVAAVFQVFKRKDFDTLETLGQELRESRERLNDGSWLSEAFFAAFGLKPEASNERYTAASELIDDWERAKPASTVLPMVKAGFHIDLAWKWRGDGYAKTVTPEGWQGFKRELAIARQLLESNPNCKAYPEYYAHMMAVGLGENWPKQQYVALFNQAISIEPDYYRFYFQMAWYLMPQWHGRKGEWEAFAEQQRQQHGAGGAGDGLYTRIAMFNRGRCGCGDLFRDTAISWDVVASGFEYLIRQYPDSRYLKSLYANVAWKEHDRVRLQRTLPAAKADPDMTIWVNLENVALAEKFAATGH